MEMADPRKATVGFFCLSRTHERWAEAMLDSMGLGVFETAVVAVAELTAVG
jgi:hypothetical protein